MPIYYRSFLKVVLRNFVGNEKPVYQLAWIQKQHKLIIEVETQMIVYIYLGDFCQRMWLTIKVSCSKFLLWFAYFQVSKV